MQPGKLTNRSRLIVLGLVVLILVLAVDWIVTFAGPYRWFVNFELSTSGSYDERLAAFVAGISALIVVVVPFRLLAFRFHWLQKQNADGPAITMTKDEWSALIRQTTKQARSAPFRIIATGIGAALFVFGAFLVVYASMMGSQATVAVADLEKGKPLDPAWIKAAGRLNFSAEQVWTTQPVTALSKMKHYVPAVSDGWKSGQPVALVVYLENFADMENPAQSLAGATSIEGTVSPQGLPNLVRQEFEKAGVRLVDQVPVIEWQSTPRDLIAQGWMSLAIGGILIVICALITLIKRWRRTSQPA